MNYYYECMQIRCIITLMIYFILEFYCYVIARRNVIHDEGGNDETNTNEMGEKEKVRYAKNTPMCIVEETSLGPIKVKNKVEISQKRATTQNRDVKLGGHAPRHCRAGKRVAVIVPYRMLCAEDFQSVHRDCRVHLSYMHPLLKKQLPYRIFVIEQYCTERFNKGTLHNIATFLETQRFSTWDCLIFHDVDLVPEDERISYSCPDHPTHMVAAVESYGYILPPHLNNFGGVTTLTPKDYSTVNGYSNFYWNWGAEDDDFYVRHILLMLSKIRYRKESLVTTKYKLLRVTEKRLFTHVIADVKPEKKKTLHEKNHVESRSVTRGNTILLFLNQEHNSFSVNNSQTEFRKTPRIMINMEKGRAHH